MSPENNLLPLKILHGLESDLQLYNDKIVFHCTNWLSWLMQGDRTILISELASVNLIGPDEQRKPYFRLNKRDGKPVTFIFKAGEWQAAQDLISTLDYRLGRRELFPPARTA